MGMGDNFDYSENSSGVFDQTPAWDVDIEEILEQSKAQQRGWLEAELERIQEQLERRDAIHERIIDELERKLDRYTDRLERLYKHGIGKIDGTRERLQNRIEEFYKDVREEYRARWRDKQQLEDERREVLRDLEEITNAYFCE